MKTRFWAIALVAMLAVTSSASCYRHTLIVDGAQGGPPDATFYHHHLIYGLVNLTGSRALAAVCPNGVAQVQAKANGISFLATMFVGYIWTPTRVRVWCSDGASSELELNPTPAELEAFRLEYREDIEAYLEALAEEGYFDEATTAVAAQ